jgi:hypothetical protein
VQGHAHVMLRQNLQKAAARARPAWLLHDAQPHACGLPFAWQPAYVRLYSNGADGTPSSPPAPFPIAGFIRCAFCAAQH